ncbi:Serine/threonine protein kinase [Lysobacter capsici AZ78]|uniref:Serine/threonine protein kinase n=3 Tax=Lysobacter capsici TaxID=435897 RepID=A0A108UDI9_9GAMM|nr:Serine/threonine protein kinase [Lysobacter capsici AZ78]
MIFMRRIVPALTVSALALLALAACQKPAEPAQPAAAAQTDTGKAPAAAPADAAPNPLEPPARVLRNDAIGYDGFNGGTEAGAVTARFGADAAAVRGAWGGEMKDNNGQRPDAKCYLLYPVRGAITHQYGFLMGADGLSGIDVYDPKALAPGGGRIGMSIDEINKAYPGKVKQIPNPSFEGAAFLQVSPPDGKDTQLVFETDALGSVTNWRIGKRGAIEPDESCTR